MFIHGSASIIPSSYRCGDMVASVDHDKFGPDFAEEALNKALSMGGINVSSITHLFHAWINYQGHPFRSPAHEIARRCGLDNCLPVGLQQLSNGGACGIVLTSRLLREGSGDDLIAVTTGDSFRLPGFDRFNSDYDLSYGDGGTALIFSASPPEKGPVYRVEFVGTRTRSEFGEMYFSGKSPSDAPFSVDYPVDIKSTKKSYIEKFGMDGFKRDARKAVAELVNDALLDAGDLPIKEIYLPRLGDKVREMMYASVLPDKLSSAVVTAADYTGHLGAGDTLANINDCVEKGGLAPGELALFLSGGGGFTWTAIMISRVQ